MAIHITHQLLEHNYELLRMTPPFNRWGLPPADEVELHATHISENAQGEYYFKGGRHVIRVNPKRHKTLNSMQFTLAHEMCHLREYMLGHRKVGCHGWMFNRLADSVCKHHGWDRGQF